MTVIEVDITGSSADPKVGSMQILCSLSATSECFPEKQAAASEVRRQVDAVQDALSKEIAAHLDADRQKQLRARQLADPLHAWDGATVPGSNCSG